MVPCCWVGGVFAVSLGFLPCAVLFLRGLQLAQLTLLQVPLGIFRSPGGDVGWASALPFFFCASPAPTGLQGLAGFCTLCQGAPVGVVSALSSPCWLSLTLGWVSFWSAVSPVSVAAEFAVSTALHGSSTFSCLWWSFTFSGVGVAWSQVCDASWGLGLFWSSVAAS